MKRTINYEGTVFTFTTGTIESEGEREPVLLMHEEEDELGDNDCLVFGHDLPTCDDDMHLIFADDWAISRFCEDMETFIPDEESPSVSAVSSLFRNVMSYFG